MQWYEQQLNKLGGKQRTHRDHRGYTIYWIGFKYDTENGFWQESVSWQRTVSGIKEYGYTFICVCVFFFFFFVLFASFWKGDNFSDFLSAWIVDEILSKMATLNGKD